MLKRRSVFRGAICNCTNNGRCCSKILSAGPLTSTACLLTITMILITHSISSQILYGCESFSTISVFRMKPRRCCTKHQEGQRQTFIEHANNSRQERHVTEKQSTVNSWRSTQEKVCVHASALIHVYNTCCQALSWLVHRLLADAISRLRWWISSPASFLFPSLFAKSRRAFDQEWMSHAYNFFHASVENFSTILYLTCGCNQGTAWTGRQSRTN